MRRCIDWYHSVEIYVLCRSENSISLFLIILSTGYFIFTILSKPKPLFILEGLMRKLSPAHDHSSVLAFQCRVVEKICIVSPMCQYPFGEIRCVKNLSLYKFVRFVSLFSARKCILKICISHTLSRIRSTW